MLLDGQVAVSAQVPEQVPVGIYKPTKNLNEEEEAELKKQAKIRTHQQLVRSLINRTSDIPGLMKEKKIKVSEIPNPHWKKESCIACHTEGAGKASVDNLRISDVETSCMNCHGIEFDHSYIHPTKITPSPAKKKVMQEDMKKQIQSNNGKVDCLTCHDMTLQCKLESRQRYENPKVFRGGPYMNRYDLCSKCHMSKDYQRFNPHEHVTESGKIIAEKCRVCHSGSIDELAVAESIDEVSFHTEKNLESICWGCHQWNPHPGGQFSFFKGKEGPNHLVYPSDKVLEKIEQTLEDKNTFMPLEPDTGRVFCATCHNPHAKGVIKNPAAAKGADSKNRLRSKKLCNNCHTK